MNKKILDINDSSFEKEVIFYNGYVLVIFWSDLCNPCKLFIKLINNIYIDFINKLRFLKLNVNKSNFIIKKYNIMSVPTIILFNKEKILFRKIGLLNKDELIKILNSYCNK